MHFHAFLLNDIEILVAKPATGTCERRRRQLRDSLVLFVHQSWPVIKITMP